MSKAPDFVRDGAAVPEADAAEAAIVGAFLYDNRLVWDAMDLVAPEDFRSERLREMFKAACSLAKRKMPIDGVTMANEIKGHKWVDVTPGDVLALMDSMPQIQHLDGYARLVREAAAARRMQVVGMSLMGLATDRDLTPDEKRDRMYQLIDGVHGRSSDGMVSLHEATELGLMEIEQLREEIDRGGTLGISTGMARVDGLLGGLQKKLYVLAGRPGVGKSALMAKWAAHAATIGKRVAIFSTEMQNTEIALRMLSYHASVDSATFNTGRIRPEYIGRIQTGQAKHRDIGDRLMIDHGAAPTANQIRAKCKRLQQQDGLDIAFVDYLQILGSEGRVTNETERVTKISNALKQTQQYLGIPLVVLSQMSREAAKEKNREPQLTDLRQSGAIEQDCDVAMLMWAPVEYEEDYDGPVEVKLLVKKHRGGRVGRINLLFDGSTFAFQEDH